MLRELVPVTNNEIGRSLKTDVVVVGSGVLGLLMAKKLGDLGESVVLLESGPTIAGGPSIKNHGWLHRGSAHAVSVKDPEQAKKVVQRLIYGHEYIKSYAPEAIEDPFEPVFTFTQDSATASRAVRTWEELGVWHEEIPREKFWEEDGEIRRDIPYFIFQSADLKINNRVFFQKLVTDIQSRGNLILTNTNFDYDDFANIIVDSNGSNLRISADTFVYCTGNNTTEAFAKLSGRQLDISFWKSHLLIVPRVSQFSLVSMDPNLPIIINHGDLSIVNRAYDEFPMDRVDNEVVEEEVDRAFESLVYLYPNAVGLRDQIESVACSKPTIKSDGQSRHSVESQILEPVPNHFFVLPGKMTESPYVADEMIRHIYQRLDFAQISSRPLDKFEKNRQATVEVRRTAVL